MSPFIGNYENIIGCRVFVKVRLKYVSGRVTQYLFKSRKYEVYCEDGKYRKVSTVYVE